MATNMLFDVPTFACLFKMALEMTQQLIFLDRWRSRVQHCIALLAVAPFWHFVDLMVTSWTVHNLTCFYMVMALSLQN